LSDDNKSNQPAVLNTPSWTPEQALIQAQNLVGDMAQVIVYFKTHDGHYRSILAGLDGPGDLFIASEMLMQRGRAQFVISGDQ
jgi:hypothetical protein